MSHKASLALLFASIPLLSCFKSGPRLADGPDQLESSELELLFPADPEAQRADLLDLLLCLQESLPTGCRFLEQGALEVVGQSPVDAGGIAEVWEGRMDGHKVATKSYRCYLASDRLLTCVVSRKYSCCVLSTEGTTSTAILQRSSDKQSSGTPEHRPIRRNVFYSRTPTGSRVRLHGQSQPRIISQG